MAPHVAASSPPTSAISVCYPSSSGNVGAPPPSSTTTLPHRTSDCSSTISPGDEPFLSLLHSWATRSWRVTMGSAQGTCHGCPSSLDDAAAAITDSSADVQRPDGAIEEVGDDPIDVGVAGQEQLR
uniref:RHO GTPase-activating protein RGD1 n=1 Tax=Anthurium amnicola TaxID=1678845 RepID=A0A1D1Y090_9ARAE